MAAKLTVGISADNGEKIHISNAMRGLQCNCICEGCGACLVAKKYQDRSDHFAHHNSEECEWARETALHEQAKQMFAKSSFVILPYGSYFDYDSAKMEVTMPGLRADVVIETRNMKMIVEIFVSHKVTPKKEEAIKANGIPCLEIDLSMVDRNISIEKLQWLLFEGTGNRRLIDIPIREVPQSVTASTKKGWFEHPLIALGIASIVAILLFGIKQLISKYIGKRRKSYDLNY